MTLVHMTRMLNKYRCNLREIKPSDIPVVTSSDSVLKNFPKVIKVRLHSARGAQPIE